MLKEGWVLCDALALASEEIPELIIDFATLTGAARVALGTEVSPYFTNDSKLSAELLKLSENEYDPPFGHFHFIYLMRNY